MYYNLTIYVPLGASQLLAIRTSCLGNINLQIVKSISDRNIFTSYFIDKLC